MVADRARTLMGDDVDLDALVDRATAGVRGPPTALRQEIRAGAARDPLDRAIDRVVEEHRAVRGVLETEVLGTLRGAGFAEPVAARRIALDGARAPSRARVGDAFTPDIEAELRRVRAERERVASDLRPAVARPVFDDPLVTRAGIFYVAPEFTQAVGIGTATEARLAAAGYRSAASVLGAPLEDIVDATGLSEEGARRAVADLDLTRIGGVDGHAADLLRLAGVHSVSKLATRDPEMVARDIAAVVDRHRIDRLPAALSSTAAVARLVREARESAA